MKEWTYKGVQIKHVGRNMYYHYNKAGKLVCSNRLDTAKSYIDKDLAAEDIVKISTDNFEKEYGMKPHGLGNWVFNISKRGRFVDTFSVDNHTYKTAKKMLIKAIKEEGLSDVEADVSTLSYMSCLYVGRYYTFEMYDEYQELIETVRIFAISEARAWSEAGDYADKNGFVDYCTVGRAESY